MHPTLLIPFIAAFAGLSNAHGLVSQVTLGGTTYQGYPAFSSTSSTQRIIRAMYNNGPITDVTSAPIACNGKNEPAALVAQNVSAGSTVSYKWDTWPDSHKGPITNYLASCSPDCTKFDATTAVWFKIDESGYDNTTKTWASDRLISNNLTYTFTLPTDIPSGQYLLRHEILALHSTNAPQYYPSCAQIEIVDGNASSLSVPSSELTTFPGAYSKSDPGYSFNIYYPPFNSYPIEGPAVAFAESNSTTSTTPSGTTVLPTSTSSPSSTKSTAPSSPASVRVCKPLSEGTALKRKRAEGLARRMLNAKRHEGVPDVLRRLVGDY